MRFFTPIALLALPAFLSSLAQANGAIPLTAAQLQAACANTSAGIGAVTTKYTYIDWQGASKTPSVTFEPKESICITNQIDWSFSFKKTSPGSPSFELSLFFTQQGNTYVLKEWPKSEACAGVLSTWFVDFWINRGGQLTESQKNAMRKNVKTSWCPAMVNAATNAIVARINGN
jgi:hypothetical protein